MLSFTRAGTGVPIILIHAFPLSQRMWDGNVAALSRNFQPIAVDLPGFGDSPFDGRSVMTMDYFADSILSALDAAGIREKAVMAGVSMGGYVLFQILKKVPERVRAAVLVSTRAVPDTDEARQKRFKTIDMIEKDGLSALADKMVPNLLGFSSLKDRPELVEKVRAYILGANAGAVCAALRGMAERPDSSGVLDTISVPSLVISGQEDAFIPSADMEQMGNRLKKKEFHVIPKAGHLPNLEQPEVFKEIFYQFLKRRVL